MKRRFFLVLLVLSLLSLSSLPMIGLQPTPVRGMVSGVLTISDQSFTQADGITQPKAFFSATAPHNVVGIEVKDADLNVHTDVAEQLPGFSITSPTATALGFPRAITLVETSASSGIFRGIIRLVKNASDPCLPASPSSDNAGCSDTIIGDNKYFGALLVADGDTITVTYSDASPAAAIAATATVDLTPPTLTIRSPADGSSTNESTVTFSVDVTDAAAGVDGSSIVSGTTPSSTLFGGLPGAPAVLQPVSKSTIANGFNFTALATGVPDGIYGWNVTASVKDLVGNVPKSVNDVDKSADFCGSNAVEGTSGNRWTVAVGAAKPALASAKTGVGGLVDTRVQESGVVTYPDVPNLWAGDPLGPRPGQPVNCATFGKLTDDINVNTVKVATVPGDPGFGAGITQKYVTDTAKAGTANKSARVVVGTAAGGRLDLEQSSISPTDFNISGINPSQVDLGPMVAGVGQVAYLTLPIPFTTGATPPVEVVGPIADAAGNTLDPATLTQAEIVAGIHKVWAADGLVPVLALSLAIAEDQAAVTLTASEAIPFAPAVSVCTDANSNNVCDAAEDPVNVTMSAVSVSQYEGTYVLQAGDLGVKKVVAVGVDAAGNAGKVTQILGTGPTRVGLQAPTAVRPGEQFSVSAQVLLLPSLNVAANAGMPVLFNYVVYEQQSGGSQTSSTTVNTNAEGVATLVMTAPMETSVVLVDAVFLDWGGLRASSNMWIVSVLPIVNARLTGTSSGGNIVFTLQDVYGNAMPGRTLTFNTTSGSLSTASGVTDASGQVSLALSATTGAVVSASFGGWISPQGWAYQPTMARITVAVG